MLLSSSFLGYSGSAALPTYSEALYVGLNGGYGSTTWKGLVPSFENQNIVLSISTPTGVNEGGAVLGAVLGFEFTPYFGLEANYLYYPDATIFFDENSIFAFENEGRRELNTRTETLTLMAKIMMTIPKTPIRAYSSVGLGKIHRKDEINDSWSLAPSFGAGFNYPFTEHLMGEIVGTYMTGYGESEISPVNDFIPFLYAVYFRLAYRL